MRCGSKRLKNYFRLCTAAVLMSLVGQSVQAETEAYWRHEEGVNGGFIAAGAGTVLDSSGNGNHMRTFDPAGTSATYSASVSPLALRSGLANTLSLNFGPGGDNGGLDDDNYSEGAAINGQSFTAITAELAFNMNAIGGFQALFGKDGKPTASVVPPLKVLVRGDDFPDAIPNQLFVEWIDGDGDVHFVTSRSTITAGNWNHMAFVLTGTTAELHLADESGNYQLVDSISGDFAGAGGEVIFNDNTNFSVGRGMFNNGVADWSDALIDEVRISDVALTRDEFLFIPEPASLLLAFIGSASLLCRSGRRGG
jgi:hypothetical protein